MHLHQCALHLTSSCPGRVPLMVSEIALMGPVLAVQVSYVASDYRAFDDRGVKE